MTKIDKSVQITSIIVVGVIILAILGYLAFQSVIPGEGVSWAICDHILTLAVSRLTAPSRKIPRIGDLDFQRILTLVHQNIPTPRK